MFQFVVLNEVNTGIYILMMTTAYGDDAVGMNSNDLMFRLFPKNDPVSFFPSST